MSNISSNMLTTAQSSRSSMQEQMLQLIRKHHETLQSESLSDTSRNSALGSITADSGNTSRYQGSSDKGQLVDIMV